MSDGFDPTQWERWENEGGAMWVHHRARCIKPCPIHAPSDHPMRDFPLHFRSDRGIMERRCPHGVGHPDPDDINEDTTHGCDGCCHE